ncbi:MAG: M48 family metallopeptidase [Candidatus Nanopelagicaceae bacterium]
MLLEALIIIVAGTFILETLLDHLNQRSSQAKPDPLVAHLYDEKEHQRSIAYGYEKNQLGLISGSLSTGLMVLAIAFGWFASLDGFVSERINNSILVSLLFIGALGFISWLISLPFAIKSTFGIEAKYGFNKATPTTFITDIVKGSVVGVIIGGSLLTAVIWLYERFEDRFWLYSWLLVAGFSIFMFMFGTKLILPLFNKLTPLQDGELKEAIGQYCKSQGYSLKNLFVMDGSKRSTKANAFFSGMGKSKTIVLFDTLIEKLSKDEIVAVLAHEIGHYKRKHTLAMFIASNIQTLAIFALLGWALQYPEFSRALGAEESKFHLSALAFFILLTPLQILLGLLNNSLSRRNEFDADTFAANTYKRAPMRSALSKISTDSLANLNPHPLYVAFNYTHPPLVQRLKNVGQ